MNYCSYIIIYQFSKLSTKKTTNIFLWKGGLERGNIKIFLRFLHVCHKTARYNKTSNK